MKQLMNTSKLFLATLILAQFAAAADCGNRQSLKSLAQKFVRVSTAGQGTTAKESKDFKSSSKAISELSAAANQSEQTKVALESAKSVVSIDAVLVEGKNIDETPSSYVGSGFIAYSQCHVFTARHVPNEHEWLVINGKRESVPKATKPLGYNVKMTMGYGPNGRPQKIEGVVIAAGSSAITAHADYAIIRLDKKVSAKPLQLIAASEAELVGVPMISLGFPANAQKVGQLEVYASLNCTSVGPQLDFNKRYGGQPTTCAGSPGVSGGPAMAKVKMADGTQEWGAVGLNSIAVSMAEKKSAKTAYAGDVGASEEKHLRIVRFHGNDDAIAKIIENDLKASPCN